MPIFADISPDNGLPIVMVAEIPPQTKRGMQVPHLLGGAKGAIKINLALVPITDGPPHPRLLEVLENPPKQHVVTLLLDVNAAGPIADVQAIPLEPAGQQLIPLLTAQIPNPRRQMRPKWPANPPPFTAREIGLRTLTFKIPNF